MGLALLSADQQSGVASVASFRSCRNPSTEQFCKTEEIRSFPKKKFPPVADYARRCKLLLEETWPERSQHQTCVKASQETGEPISTFYRIMAGETKSPDARLMLLVLSIRARRNPAPFNLGNGFAVRIIMEGQE